MKIDKLDMELWKPRPIIASLRAQYQAFGACLRP
jgi:hypothetical protein